MEFWNVVKKIGVVAYNITLEGANLGAKNVDRMTDDELTQALGLSDSDPNIEEKLRNFRSRTGEIQRLYDKEKQRAENAGTAYSDSYTKPHPKSENRASASHLLWQYNKEIENEKIETADKFCSLLGKAMSNEAFKPIWYTNGNNPECVVHDKDIIANAYYCCTNRGESAIQGRMVWILRSFSCDYSNVDEGVVFTTKGIYLIQMRITGDKTRFVPYADIRSAYVKKGILVKKLIIELNNDTTVEYDKTTFSEKFATALNHIVGSVYEHKKNQRADYHNDEDTVNNNTSDSLPFSDLLGGFFEYLDSQIGDEETLDDFDDDWLELIMLEYLETLNDSEQQALKNDGHWHVINIPALYADWRNFCA